MNPYKPLSRIDLYNQINLLGDEITEWLQKNT